MRGLLLVMALLVLSPNALDAARWEGAQVVVYDYSGWLEVEDAVALVNEALPKKAPRIIYRAMPLAACEDVPRKKGITVCVAPRLFDPLGVEVAGTTIGYDRRPITWGRVALSGAVLPADRLRVACHELFHATTGIGPHGAWTTMRPCPFDVAYAKRVYKRHGRH
jgi:hypothetical protein